MPELPEITAYIDALGTRILGRELTSVRIRSPSLLKTYDLSPSEVAGRRVMALRRIGKRIAWAMEGDLFLVIHLMLTGRLHWREAGAGLSSKGAHAAFDFPGGTLLLTEAGPEKRASLHLVRGERGLSELDRGGVEPLECSLSEFRASLARENRTLKRALTDPRVVSGIGNAHSDEILFRARLSPVKRTHQLEEHETGRLFEAMRESLREWVQRLREEAAGGFPEKITAFHPAMSVHGKFGHPCPECGSSIQRIVYRTGETNYCPRCQTGGRLLADRALSRILRHDWPRALSEWEGA